VEIGNSVSRRGERRGPAGRRCALPLLCIVGAGIAALIPGCAPYQKPSAKAGFDVSPAGDEKAVVWAASGGELRFAPDAASKATAKLASFTELINLGRVSSGRIPDGHDWYLVQIPSGKKGYLISDAIDFPGDAAYQGIIGRGIELVDDEVYQREKQALSSSHYALVGPVGGEATGRDSARKLCPGELLRCSWTAARLSRLDDGSWLRNEGLFFLVGTDAGPTDAPVVVAGATIDALRDPFDESSVFELEAGSAASLVGTPYPRKRVGWKLDDPVCIKLRDGNLAWVELADILLDAVECGKLMVGFRFMRPEGARPDPDGRPGRLEAWDSGCRKLLTSGDEQAGQLFSLAVETLEKGNSRVVEQRVGSFSGYRPSDEDSVSSGRFKLERAYGIEPNGDFRAITGNCLGFELSSTGESSASIRYRAGSPFAYPFTDDGKKWGKADGEFYYDCPGSDVIQCRFASGFADAHDLPVFVPDSIAITESQGDSDASGNWLTPKRLAEMTRSVVAHYVPEPLRDEILSHGELRYSEDWFAGP
jgi:hypothetical protein